VRGTTQPNRSEQSIHIRTDAALPSKLNSYDFAELVKAVVSRVLAFHNKTAPALTLPDQAMFRSWVFRTLEPWCNKQQQKHPHERPSIKDLIDRLLDFDMGFGKVISTSDGFGERESLANGLTSLVLQFLSKTHTPSDMGPDLAFSSAWLAYLYSRGILADPEDELNWSGRGQHVEYEPVDEKIILLVSEKILGNSTSAIVDSVRCRRIRLARKIIHCHRRLKKETAIIEVEHLQRLQRAHTVRVVGTYTLKKNLAILIYPATQWNLDEFMDELLDPESSLNTSTESSKVWQHRISVSAMGTFFGCLSNAVSFIHDCHVKHMDIKPKNLLVRLRGIQEYKIYIADFGIARAYKTAADSFTDSPVAFTRAYAAPEVVYQDARGLSADVFSLGCVFIGMLATILSSPTHNRRQVLLELRTASGDASFYKNIDLVRRWYDLVTAGLKMNNVPSWSMVVLHPLFDTLPKMIVMDPKLRPSMAKLQTVTEELCCQKCGVGPEPFEAA
jgi:tRNA A-37 threonylcarbamoyl transferase component Bud32